MCNAAKGLVNNIGKKYENDQGQEEQDQQFRIRDVQKAFCIFSDPVGFEVDDNISVRFVVGGNRCQYGQMRCRKAAPEGTFRVQRSGKGSWIKTLDKNFFILVDSFP